MKIVKLKGGLGNQMFQYAFAKNIEMVTGETVKFDISTFNVRKDDDIRKPRLFEFKINGDIATDSQIAETCILNHNYDLLSFKYKLSIQIENIINSKYFFRRDCKYYPINNLVDYEYFDGYWQSWRYVDTVRDKLKFEFKPKKNISIKSSLWIEKLKKQNSVFVGIRKGDYSSSRKVQKKYGEFDSYYYERAMEYICGLVQNPIFYIFSNDIEWVKRNMKFEKYNVYYRDIEDQVSDFEELIVISSCKHFIIANSTFHWWGAWLSNTSPKIIISPQKWFANGWQDDLIPPSWVKIENN